MSEFVRLWIDLVRAVVGDDDGDERPAAPRAAPPRRVTSAPVRPTRAADDHPARIAVPVAEHVPEPALALSRDEPVRAARDLERATRDELTGVLNRSAGFAALEREIDRCRRGGERFVLGYLNVDAMTAINDTRGLRAGDEVLRKVTAALRATLRSYDVIARLGGDEFVFSLPGSDLSTAELRFKEFAVILAEEAPGCTASVGFAELRQHDDLDDLVATAETAMLKGRRTRRRGRA
ncbi:MAG TPA: GGDEF domain-containing protein, partial [Acidimicrobiales bacterium]|nr:GGDEF domain-containing protein [Acidimicrobiales bacterium]